MTNPQLQFQSRTVRARVSKLTIFALLLLMMLAGAVFLSPRSQATRSLSSPESFAAKRHRPDFVPGEALVRFKKNSAFEGKTILDVAQEDALQTQDVEPIAVEVDRFEGSDLVEGLRIARMAEGDTLKAVAALNARDDVLYAEPNYLLRVDATPNDPLLSQLYGMNLIGAPQAWDITKGDKKIVVAVIDEGIDITHPDLQANIWANPSPGSISGITGDVNGYDFHDNTGTIVPEPHATHVAGTIGAEGNNGIGVAGVNWQVSLMSLRFISAATNSGTDADAIKAYNYVKQMRDLWVNTNHAKGADIRVVNASYGGGGYSQASADAINALGQAGVLFVAAAGNEAANSDIHPHYPSGYSLPNMISVAATTSGDTLASFSNFGAHSVLIGAPGSGIVSTTPKIQSLCATVFTDANGYTYSSCSGTSMASPHVAGAAALLCAANPSLSVSQLRALLAFNGDPTAALQGKSLTGRRLNVFKSLQALKESDLTPPGTPASFQINSQSGRTVNLSWIASGDDGAAGQASLYDVSFVDQSTSKVVPLTIVAPAASGATQNLTVNLPYRHTAGTLQLRETDNVGNEGTPASTTVSVPVNFADPYTTALNPPAALSTGGTATGLTGDDRYLENYPLPFSFSFFGQLYNSVTISTNGNLYFSSPPKRANGDADDVPGSIADLANSKMIAGMWDDLDLSTSRRPDAGVYVVQNTGGIIFRWQGVQFGDGKTGDQINFEVELRSDGSIITRYGSGNTNLLPVVGTSAGEADPYVIDQLTSELSPKTLTNAQSATFTPRATVQLTSATYTVNEGAGHANITLTRSGDLSNSASVSFATSDTAGTQPCATVNAKASSRCDYVTTFGVAQFAAGESSKTVTIPIIDDGYAEGDESFAVAISNGSGTSIGAQTTATVTINDNDSPAGGSSPLVVTDFFVREQYLDFLNREPDAPGLQFWSNNINGCSPQPSCVDVQRINTSAAFFLSIEFQDTGYLVYRLYKAAYADAQSNSTLGGTSHSLNVPMVRFSEFLPDTQRIGQAVIVNQGNWQQQLEDNKNAFVEEFVQRPRFTSAFPDTMTALQFVNALNANAGNPLSAPALDQLINDLNSGAKDRAQVLRAVAESGNLRTSEFNRAFVLMQYFGYLRRNPNDAPEATSDYTGYEFWLNKLNQFNGNFIDAEMVKAFLTSSEYNQRFSK